MDECKMWSEKWGLVQDGELEDGIGAGFGVRDETGVSWGVKSEDKCKMGSERL